MFPEPLKAYLIPYNAEREVYVAAENYVCKLQWWIRSFLFKARIFIKIEKKWWKLSTKKLCILLSLLQCA